MKTDWRSEWKPLASIAGLFLLCFFLPVGAPRFDNAVDEAFHLVKWYAREHVILCLLPAFFIAGAISVFVSSASVMKYLGPESNKLLAYGVGSVAGTILAVCSCTILPLFAGIWRMGAGLGPAAAFLYSGPAINILAIILTARVLGPGLGLARAFGAVGFSVLIGLAMHLVFRSEEKCRIASMEPPPVPAATRPPWQTAAHFGCMIGILVFANWGKPAAQAGLWHAIWMFKWPITSAFALLLAAVLVRWFGLSRWKVAIVAALAAGLGFAIPREPQAAFLFAVAGLSVIASTSSSETSDWFASAWDFAKQITPLLLLGVLAAGFLLGRPGKEGVIPSAWIVEAVGGNSFRANLLAAVVGAFMYFATLTEVPILQGLIGSGMGQGPALALLLAGPALSLQSILVLRTVMGAKKTFVYVALVISMSTLAGLVYGNLIE